MAALESLKRGLPKIIVTDLQMPRMDGLALVKAVKSEYPSVPYRPHHGARQRRHRGAAPCAAAPPATCPSATSPKTWSKSSTRLSRLAASHHETEAVTVQPRRDPLSIQADQRRLAGATLVKALEEVVLEMGLCDRGRAHSTCRRPPRGDHQRHRTWQSRARFGTAPGRRARISAPLADKHRELSPYRERRVRIDVGVTRSEATFTICDDGPGFDPKSLPDPTDPANLCRIGGRGLLLIRTLMDEVQLNATGNQIVLIKRRRAVSSSRETAQPNH